MNESAHCRWSAIEYSSHKLGQELGRSDRQGAERARGQCASSVSIRRTHHTVGRNGVLPMMAGADSMHQLHASNEPPTCFPASGLLHPLTSVEHFRYLAF